jgi:hypothetical protein
MPQRKSGNDREKDLKKYRHVNSWQTMKKTISITITGFLAFAAMSLFTSMHSATDACLAQVKNVFDKMNSCVVNNHVLYLNYTVTSYVNATEEFRDNTVSTLTFELITNKVQTRLYSKQAIVLKDEKHTFTILPEKKTIYWANGVLDKTAAPIYNRLAQMQDTIFKNVKKIECVDVKQKSYNKTVTLYLNERMAKQQGVEKATYCYNDVNNLLSQVILEYLPENNYKRVVYDFNKTDFNYQQANMKIAVEKLVFESKNKLKKEYQGFQINDNRINKK